MKLIIAGGRDIFVGTDLITCLIGFFKLDPDEVVCGGAKGVDSTGAQWARSRHRKSHVVEGHIFKDGHIPVTMFDADWETYGLAAGPIRNEAMAKYADVLLLIWDGKSKGSSNMRQAMLAKGKPVHEVILKNYEKD